MDNKYNIPYVLRQVERYENAIAQDKQKLAMNCLWRIASNAEIFGENLDLDGNLTSEQLREVEEFITSVKDGFAIA